jgi:hypothetical protein
MAFGIDQFASEIGRSGVAKTSDFLVEITVPPMAFSSVAQAMMLRIEQVSIPSRTLTTFQQNYYGPPRDIPYRFVSSPITLTILLSEDMREREFFMKWQDLFIGDRRSPVPLRPEAIYDCGYFKDCVGTVTIKQYGTSPGFQGRSQGSSLFGDIKDAAEAFGFNTSAILNPLGLNLFGSSSGGKKDPTELYKIDLVEAFPITVNEIQMNWGDDQIAKLQVEIRYTYMTEKHPASDITGAVQKSFLRKGIEAFQRFAPVFSLVKASGVGGAIRSVAQSTGQGVVNAGTAAKSILPF